MKIKIVIPLIVLTLVLVTKSVFAEEIATSTPKTIRGQIREEKKEIKQELKATISELKLKRSEAIYKAIRLNLTKRYDALANIKNKLEARIVKNPTKKDTAAATTKLKELVAIQSSYIQNLAIFDAKYTEITTSDTTKFSELVNQLKTAASMIKIDLNSFKKILREAVVLLAQSPKLQVTETE